MTKAEIQLIRSLEDKRSREETGLFVAEGEKLVGEVLASDLTVRKVYFTQGPRGEWEDVDCEHIPPREMERISRLKTPATCLALVAIPRRPSGPESLRGRLTLALDGVQNPGNLGTIVRLADWFGIHDVLCSADCADCWSPKVVQATMGAITRVRVRYGDLEQMLARAVAASGHTATGPVPVYGTYLEGENIFGADLTQEGVIVLGSEGRGISSGVGRLVARKLFIPSFPAAPAVPAVPAAPPTPSQPVPESLNVSIAAAIVCSEFRRRQ